jgi:hypothetical protein
MGQKPGAPRPIIVSVRSKRVVGYVVDLVAHEPEESRRGRRVPQSGLSCWCPPRLRRSKEPIKSTARWHTRGKEIL